MIDVDCAAQIFFADDAGVLRAEEHDDHRVVGPEHDGDERADHAVGRRVALVNQVDPKHLPADFPEDGGERRSAECFAPTDADRGTKR